MASTAVKDSHLILGAGFSLVVPSRPGSEHLASEHLPRNLGLFWKKRLLCLSFPPAQFLLLTTEHTIFRARLPPQPRPSACLAPVIP